ncbi:MAG: tRNA (guanosine(46)-N7)-methyltransferase TrmB [Bacteroidales bacterium]|jgi:tRNA (guanine-N7-)-methyltransferase|nr:tRNA (guanosine(46)-N7)-methyltransferase TrmB [Bacteroidales bacterium]MDD2618208.1 tRNA (guanosine(46)-N7)-methyltransferase TrmB [Bacteroidales bacterium]MDD4640790.1 tRNA (guanosine(46)-N7)-methyltransferase TrmB [Bacteroidales bacterium]NLB02025.1 tRNA (guanosine(46)-N7)-methyltransferase TrmB [Bacteroidales bacterium]
MAKNKLKKFEDLRNWGHVFEFPLKEGRLPECNLKGNWSASVFGNDQALVLELGCGKGEYTVGLARSRPDMNFIGIDIKGARMWTGARQAMEEGLKNAAFLRTQIELLSSFFAPGEVAEIWLTFPDPQMKKVRKRLTSTYFMRMYQRIMAKNAVLHLKTDSRFMYEYSLAVLNTNGLTVHFQTQDLYADLLPVPDIQTFYEQQWLLRGIKIKYLQWSIPVVPEWKEPEVDIEPDAYRSFGRSARVLPKNKQL